MAGEDSMGVPEARTDTRLTYDDLVLFPDDGQRHEIIDGVHYVTAAPNQRHQIIIWRLSGELYAYLKVHPDVGRAFFAPFDVLLSRHDIVEPDLLFIAHERLDVLTEKNVQGPPSLVVEVLSPSTRKRDTLTKRRLFERSGVDEYWLVDPELDTVQMFRLSESGKYQRVAELTAEDDHQITTPLLPGWSLSLKELFAD